MIQLLGLEEEPAEAFAWIVQNLPPEWFNEAIGRIQAGFGFSCEAFMLLQAMVALGFCEDENVRKAFGLLCGSQLPDGGFLCEKRKKKLNYLPKSCYKADYYALRLCACCRKKGFPLI